MSGVSSVTTAPLADALASGVDELGLTLDRTQQDLLLDYVALLDKWNKVYNLTAVREPERMIGLHILDSLSIVPTLLSTQRAMIPLQNKAPVIPAQAGIHPDDPTRDDDRMDSRLRGNDRDVAMLRMIDVGSGGGLPGICVAIAAPMLEVVMLDSLQKKTTFVRQAIGELGLDNASVVCERVEKFSPTHKFDIVTSRAFAELADFVKGAAHLVAPGGKMLAMKGVYPHDEIARVPASHHVTHVIELRVPQVEGARHLVTIEPR